MKFSGFHFLSRCTFWDPESTSDLSRHVTGRLLSHLDHQETTVSRRGSSYHCSRASPPCMHDMQPPRCVKPLKTAPHISVGSYRAFFHIVSTERRHRTSAEPSKLSGNDGYSNSSQFIPINCATRCECRGRGSKRPRRVCKSDVPEENLTFSVFMRP